MYDAHDNHDDNGNMPLLNRPSSQAWLHIPTQVDEDDDSRIPQRVPRRYKTLKKVESVTSLHIVVLYFNDIYLDSSIVTLPKKLLDLCASRTEGEFTHTCYSAATCDPNDFKDDGFTL